MSLVTLQHGVVRDSCSNTNAVISGLKKFDIYWYLKKYLLSRGVFRPNAKVGLGILRLYHVSQASVYLNCKLAGIQRVSLSFQLSLHFQLQLPGKRLHKHPAMEVTSTNQEWR